MIHHGALFRSKLFALITAIVPEGPPEGLPRTGHITRDLERKAETPTTLWLRGQYYSCNARNLPELSTGFKSCGFRLKEWVHEPSVEEKRPRAKETLRCHITLGARHAEDVSLANLQVPVSQGRLEQPGLPSKPPKV